MNADFIEWPVGGVWNDARLSIDFVVCGCLCLYFELCLWPGDLLYGLRRMANRTTMAQVMSMALFDR